PHFITQQCFHYHTQKKETSGGTSRAEPQTMPTFDVPYFRYIDDEGTEGEEEWSSSRSLSSIGRDSSADSVVSDRYAVVSGTPEKILEHLLSDMTLEDDRGTTQAKESDMLLDDFLLTYPVFMSTGDLCQALLGQYPCKEVAKEDAKEALERKQKVLHLVWHWMSLCKGFLREDEHVKVFLKSLHLTVAYAKVRCEVVAQELLQEVAERIDVAASELILVAITYPGGKQLLLQPQDRVFSNSLRPVGRLHVCRKDLSEVLNPFRDNSDMQQRTARVLNLNTWDVAVALTNFDWTIFNSMHEQELVYFTFNRNVCSSHTKSLELLLQRCNEVQLWVMTEVLLCPTLCKRVQLIKKFIKIAAHCKAQRNLNSFFSIIMGLNAAAVSRLSQTWETHTGIPGELDSFKKMKSPKIPFLPLVLKDITFIHEGNKTFHDNLVNFEKLHMIADMARFIRECQQDPVGQYSDHLLSYIDYLHVIDNQQTLFELSHRLEPRA
uniref:Rap guanine nucleotide exchange factor 5 n=1 Tax=Fundulus heteroclitus TaxID=8078 RepID=A0A3Q2QQ09_FUNHE